jgi:hypothetical protein
MQAGVSSVIDPTRPKAEQCVERSAELRQAVLECYCGLGPACILWRQMTPEQRAACSADRRLTAQRMWKNGM